MSTLRRTTNVSKNTDYTVKNYVGLTIVEVENELTTNNIKYDVVYEIRDDMDEGIVIAQSISEGVVISAQSLTNNLVITVSSAQEQIILADYSGVDLDTAKASLEALGLVVSQRSEISEDVESGIVLRTEPEAFSSLQPGDQVVLVYAIQADKCEVPDILGMNLEEAEEALTESDLVMGNVIGAAEVTEDLPKDEQIVIITDPAPGETRPRHSAVNVYVGTMTDYENGGTPTPTPPLINIAPGISGAGTVSGGGEYAPDTEVVLVATPSEGSQFLYWVDDMGNVVSYDPTLTFICDENYHPYTAYFGALPTATPTPTPPPTPTPEPTPTPTPVPEPPPASDPTQNTNPPGGDPNQPPPEGWWG